MSKDIKILAVDDDPDLLKILTKYLESNEYQVIQAQNGQEAITQAEAQQPHLIIMDVMMPDINGFDVVRQLKSNSSTANISVLMLTAKQNEEAEQSMKESEANDFLSKPYSKDQLIEKVQSLLN